MSAPTQQSVTLVFQDAAANPLAGGLVRLTLNVDISIAVSSGPQIAAQRTVDGTLDDSGSVTLNLWPNDVLFPANSVYFVQAYTSTGQPAWDGQMTVSS